MSNNLINAIKLSVFRDNNEVLKDINWNLNEGECHVITGSNNSGKTSLLNALLCDFQSCRGQLSLLGYAMLPVARENLRYLRQRVGMSKQNPSLLLNKTVRINMLMPLQASDRFNEVEAEAKINELLNEFALDYLLKREVRCLSFSELHIISFLCAIVHKPKLLLLDNSLDPLDAKWRPIVLDKLRNLSQKENMGIVITSTSELVLEFPNAKMLRLQSGTLIESGS